MTVKRGNDSGGVISKGNTTMLIALGPWKKEREKEGEFFLVEDGGHQFFLCVQKRGLILEIQASHFSYTNAFQVYRLSSYLKMYTMMSALLTNILNIYFYSFFIYKKVFYSMKHLASSSSTNENTLRC